MIHQTTFYSVVRQIRSFLSEGLCANEYWDKIGQMAGLFPILSQGMLEIRLTDQEPQIDFGVLIVREWGEMDLLLDFYKDKHLLKESEDHLKRILEVCRQTTKDNGLLAQTIQNIWVAFDTNNRGAVLPYVYFVTGPRPFIPEIIALISKQILYQYGNRLTDLQYSNMLESLIALPPSVNMEAFGFFENRYKGVLRLALRPFYCMNSIITYLEAVQAHTSLGNHHQLLAALIDATDSCQLLLDVTDRVTPRIGLEFWLDRSNHFAKSTKMLNLLVSNDFCSAQRRDQLLEWVSDVENHESPNHHRWINHVKFTFEHGKPLQSKVYLSFSSKMQKGR